MIKITLTTDNAAFGDSPTAKATEVARILRDLAGRLDHGFTFHKVRDANGNTVGAVERTGKDRAL